MEENQLSTTMWVALLHVVASCHCNTCKKLWTAVIEVSAVKLTNRIEEYKIPNSIECPACKNWDTLVVVYDIKRKKK